MFTLSSSRPPSPLPLSPHSRGCGGYSVRGSETGSSVFQQLQRFARFPLFVSSSLALSRPLCFLDLTSSLLSLSPPFDTYPPARPRVFIAFLATRSQDLLSSLLSSVSYLVPLPPPESHQGQREKSEDHANLLLCVCVYVALAS